MRSQKTSNYNGHDQITGAKYFHNIQLGIKMRCYNFLSVVSFYKKFLTKSFEAIEIFFRGYQYFKEQPSYSKRSDALKDAEDKDAVVNQSCKKVRNLFAESSKMKNNILTEETQDNHDSLALPAWMYWGSSTAIFAEMQFVDEAKKVNTSIQLTNTELGKKLHTITKNNIFILFKASRETLTLNFKSND